MIYIGADHGGFELKEKLKSWLKKEGYVFEDVGAHKLDSEDDYPRFAFAVAENVGREDNPTLEWQKRSKGILICRSAAGVVIAANKVVNVRAVALFSKDQAKHARLHNDANVIGISGDHTNEQEAQQIILAFLTTEFFKEARHIRRLDQIAAFEFENTCMCAPGEKGHGCGGNGGCSCG
ncbi:RpiB/LacA/LacB family sugar-phosphate isomerase [Candidatus Microgenomates bacterium]|nr:MAG: RpiB/LacA/LacB family sugar-phosphate isomerase [Candidatus Microgenomates bacterium]